MNEKHEMPNLNFDVLHPIDIDGLAATKNVSHPPRILLLYGSLRERSFSRLVAEEAARIAEHLGAETKMFNPRDLPLVDSVDESHAKVQELRKLASWAEEMIWVSPERHGAMTGIMKMQIDWSPFQSVQCAQLKEKPLR